MRKLSGMLFILVAILTVASMATADEKPWFDLQNCEMCKPMMESQGFKENVTWETFPIEHGMLDVTTVKPEFKGQYKETHAKMMANWGRIQAGEKLNVCGMCSAFMAAYDESVKMETVETMNGEVTVTTSDKPETVAKLQEIAKRNQVEMAKMMASEKGMEGHEGHDH